MTEFKPTSIPGVTFKASPYHHRLAYLDRSDVAGYIVRDARPGKEPREHVVESKSELVQLLADLSAVNDHYAIGDALHRLTSFLGIPRCDDCAKRQVEMNNAIKKPWGD
jgi:hypothetical protein